MQWTQCKNENEHIVAWKNRQVKPLSLLSSFLTIYGTKLVIQQIFKGKVNGFHVFGKNAFCFELSHSELFFPICGAELLIHQIFNGKGNGHRVFAKMHVLFN